MSVTFTQIANDALADLGVILLGQTATSDLLNGCLRSANERVDLWALDKLLVYASPSTQFDLVALQKQYTIGPTSADFTAPRPTFIDDANLILNTVSPVVSLPMRFYNVDQWADIPVKDFVSGGIPEDLYYVKDYDATNGWATILIWPAPNAAYKLELFSNAPLTSFANLTTAYNFPPGYQRLIAKQLTVDVAPRVRFYSKLAPGEFDKQVIQASMDARDAKGLVSSYNAPNPLAICDPSFASATRAGGSGSFLDGWLPRGV